MTTETWSVEDSLARLVDRQQELIKKLTAENESLREALSLNSRAMAKK